MTREDAGSANSQTSKSSPITKPFAVPHAQILCMHVSIMRETCPVVEERLWTDTWMQRQHLGACNCMGPRDNEGPPHDRSWFSDGPLRVGSHVADTTYQFVSGDKHSTKGMLHLKERQHRHVMNR